MSFALIFDGLALCVLLFFGIRGMSKGFLNELIGLIGFFVSIYCAWRFYDLLAEPMMRWLPNLDTNIVSLISGALIFVAVSIVISLLNMLLSMLIGLAGLSFLDHILGVVIGVVKTFMLLLVIYGTCMTFSSIIPTDWMFESYAMRAVSITWPPVRDFLQRNNLLNTNAFMTVGPDALENKQDTRTKRFSSANLTDNDEDDEILAVPDMSAAHTDELDLSALLGGRL